MKLLIGTLNQGKQQFYRGALARFFPDLHVVTPIELGIDIRIEETGETFEENATIKALAWARASNLPALSVDGGMMVDALNGAPGIYTHRWAGENTTDKEKTTFLLEKLKGVPLEKRGAKWREAVVIAKPNGKFLLESAEDRGVVLERPVLIPNPYRGLWAAEVWFVKALGKPWLTLTPEEHERNDSTYQVLRKLQPELYGFLSA